MTSFSLLVKLAAVSFFGATAFLSHRKLRREETLFLVRRNILRHTRTLSPPPTILVLGFLSHGKSAFINTVCRVLSGEEGPLVLRSETAPPSTPPSSPTTKSECLVRLPATWSRNNYDDDDDQDGDNVDKDHVVEMVDTPGFSPLAIANVNAAVSEMLNGRTTTVECAVVVGKCPGAADVKKKMMELKKLAELTNVVRSHGLSVVVVLTHKAAMKNSREVEELRKEAVAMARTDCVYIIDNYTKDKDRRRPFSPPLDFETHLSVLAIVRQCMEYTMIRRIGNRVQRRQKMDGQLATKQ